MLAALLSACATQPTPDVDTFAQHSASNSFEVFQRSVDSDGLVLAVVHDRQTSPTACGAHALASVVNYWHGPKTVSGAALYKAHPPANPNAGYSLAELQTLAVGEGLVASPVRLDQDGLKSELNKGRPVLVPIRAPAIFVATRTLPGQRVPVLGFARNVIESRAARLAEFTKRGLVNHYLVIAGYERDRFVVVEPVMGFRTISFSRLARYRKPFGNAALVMSASAPPPATLAAAAVPPKT